MSGTSVPQPGDPAPQIALLDDAGTPRRIADERGRWVVLYFYPRDMTPGCTVEACQFNDAGDELQAAGATVWGVSPQDARSHRRFRERHGLSFPLLVDTDHAAAEAYGAWGERSFLGKRFAGIARTTFLIDPEGRVVRTWEKVRPDGHAAEVLAVLRAMQGDR